MSIGNAQSYTNPNSHGDINTNGDSATTDTNTYCNSNSDADAHGYAYTNADYSLSTLTDHRPYQGSQHTVKFHGISECH